MTMVKKFFLTLCAAVLVPFVSARAQDVGVLLGLRSPDDSGDTFRTYWITRERETIRLVASGPDLIVPRAAGFWRVCVVSNTSLVDDELSEQDSLVAAPATPTRGLCKARLANDPADEDRKARCQSTSRTILTFVGSKAASVEEHGESNCGAHYSGGTDLMLRALDTGKRIELTKLPTPTRKALRAATLRAAREEFADLGTVDTAEAEPEYNDAGAHFDLVDQWGVERAPGYWKMKGQASCSPYVACGDGSRVFSIDKFAAPASIVGHNDLSPSLATIRSAYPEVRDAISSPRHDLLVAVTDDSLIVFLLDKGVLGKPALRLPASGQIVMAEWALGRFVPMWSNQLRGLLRAH